MGEFTTLGICFFRLPSKKYTKATSVAICGFKYARNLANLPNPFLGLLEKIVWRHLAPTGSLRSRRVVDAELRLPGPLLARLQSFDDNLMATFFTYTSWGRSLGFTYL